MKYHYPKVIGNDVGVFPSVARILDGMLKNVDPSNPVLLAYLQTFNPNDVTVVLLQSTKEGSSKKP